MFSCLRNALLLLRCAPAFLNNAKETKRLRSLAIDFRFIAFSYVKLKNALHPPAVIILHQRVP